MPVKSTPGAQGIAAGYEPRLSLALVVVQGRPRSDLFRSPTKG